MQDDDAPLLIPGRAPASQASRNVQFAALPYRVRGRRLEILLVTSRESRRWIAPKGWPKKGLSPSEAAAAEAHEEAGLIGVIEPDPIGSFAAVKRLSADESVPVEVLVFPFRVEARARQFKEKGQRRSRWFRGERAARAAGGAGLRRVIKLFVSARAPGPSRP